MYIVAFLVILCGGFLSLVEHERARRTAYVTYLAFALPLLFLIAGFRAVGVDGDSPLYLGWFNGIINDQMSDGLFSKDPAFVLFSLLVHTAGFAFEGLLALYTGICMASQFFFLKASVSARWFSLGLFLVLCRYYIPHEMTQIRASVAIPVMSLAIVRLSRRQFQQGVLLYCLALVFHLSTLIALPLCVAILCGARFETKGWLQWITGTAVLLHVAFEKLSVYLVIFSRLSDYVNGNYEVEANSLLSFYFLLRVALIVFVYFFLWEKLQRTERIIVLCSLTGLALEAAFSSNAAFAIRSAEVFGMFDVAAGLLLLQHLGRRTVPVYALLLLAAGANFYRSSTKIIEPYRAVWMPVHAASIHTQSTRTVVDS